MTERSPSTGYLLDNQAIEAKNRFDALSSLFDASTFRHIDALGIAPGWRVWEVGAGGTSVLEWLATRVGPAGHVLATDIDVSLARSAASNTVEVLRHDVGRDEPPLATFDLVHARLVLVHVAERDRALLSMVRALRPDGYLLVEDADPALQPLACLDEYGPEQALANKLRRGFRALLSERGVDLAYGRRLPRLLRESGLVEVAADAYFPVTLPASARLEAATIRQLHDALIERGLGTPEELERHLTAIDSGRLDLVTSPMISAWGRRR